ncbi:MAG: hypothetical protein NTZ12_11245 [Candidatus Aminicenantes bacterium]|nr:hypothetical protein [Candidatus Aminicenantes bacterium]
MKKLSACLFVVLGVISLTAQSPVFHYFDQKNLIDIQGQVLAIDFEEIYGKKSAFLMLSIQSEDQRLFQVEVCPQWFFTADIAVGMRINIRGSLLENSAGTTYLIAQEISLQGERFTLRDSKGFPLWSRSGGGRHGNRKGSGGRGKQ